MIVLPVYEFTVELLKVTALVNDQTFTLNAPPLIAPDKVNPFLLLMVRLSARVIGCRIISAAPLLVD